MGCCFHALPVHKPDGSLLTEENGNLWYWVLWLHSICQPCCNDVLKSVYCCAAASKQSYKYSVAQAEMHC